MLASVATVLDAGMEIVFGKISSDEHSVRVIRADGSEDFTRLNSRSFLRHDLAHLAVEIETPISRGYWGSVAAGASLAGTEIRGPDILIAESLAGPAQTLMRVEASDAEFFASLSRIRPELISKDVAGRIREKGRQLQGHWRATPFGGEMKLHWQEALLE